MGSHVISRLKRILRLARKGQQTRISTAQNERRTKVRITQSSQLAALAIPDAVTVTSLKSLICEARKRVVTDRCHRHSSGTHIVELCFMPQPVTEHRVGEAPNDDGDSDDSSDGSCPQEVQ